MHLAFLLPGDPDARTGGYEYDRRIVHGLRALAWRVDVHRLDASFPDPTPAALDHAGHVLGALPDGALVVVDGLALGALPDVAGAHAARLALVGLVHHPLAAETGLHPGRAAALFASERAALAAVRGAIVTSRTTARALERYGVAPERVEVVVPGTDPAPLAAGSGGARLELACVASITARKGHVVLVEALAALADRAWHLTCAGSLAHQPETARAVQAAVARHGLGTRITFAGELDRPALDALYARADAFVLATLHEGYGMAFAEALARGLPVVGTRAGAVPEVVPARAGVLVPPGDVAALRAALARVLDDRTYRATLAAGARAARAGLPDWAAQVARFAAALQRFAPR